MPSTRRLESILAAYWKCDSLYGATVGADSIGTNILNQGTVASVTGKVYEAASFTRASSQYLAIASNATLQSLKSFAFWIKFTTISNDMTIIQKGSTATAANSSVWIKYDTGNNRLQYQVGDGAGNSATCSTSGFTFATATWYFVCCRYDTAAGKLSISINGTLYGSTSATLTQFVETGTLYLGRSSAGDYLDGALDEVCCSTSSFTIAEELTQYNGGTGIQVPFLEGPIGVSSSSGRYPRRLPPSFAQSGNGKLLIAYGDEGVRKWDGLATSFALAGVPAPTLKPVISSAGEGRIIGERYAYVRNIDADGRASNLSPISDKLNAWGTPHTITAASNAAPIVITSATHGLTSGEAVFIQGVQGNTAANGTWNVVVVDANTYQLVGSAGNGDFLGVNSGQINVTTLRDGASAVNEVQTITASGTPSGGTWTITFQGDTTSALAATANAATVQTALRLLPSINGANITVTGGGLGTAAFTLTFIGTLAGANQPEVTVDGSLLLGASVTVSVVTLTQGSPAQSEVQQFQLYGTPTGGTFTLTFNGQTTTALAYNASIYTVRDALCNLSNILGTDEVQTLTITGTPTGGTFTMTYSGQTTSNIAFDATAATVITALEALSNIGAGDVTGTGGPLPGTAVVITFRQALGRLNVALMTADGALLTGGASPAASVALTTAGVDSDVTLSGGTLPGSAVVVTFGSALANTNVAELTINGASLTGGAISATVSTVTPGVPGLSSGNTAYWKLNETSGTRFASVGSVDLDEFLTAVGFDTGKVGNAALFVDGTNVLTAEYDTSLVPTSGGDFTIGFWVYFDDLSQDCTLVQNAGNGSKYSYGCTFVQSTSKFQFFAGEAAGNGNETVYSSVSPTTATWYFVACVIEGANKKVKISINAGGFSETTGAATLGYPGNGASRTSVGNEEGGQQPLQGRIDELGLWQRALTASEIAVLVNSGNGTTTPFSSGTNEVQRITVAGSPSQGSFTLTFGAATSAAIAFNASAATIDSALEAMSTIGSGNVSCSGGPLPGSTVDVTFTGTLAATDVAQMTANDNLLKVSITTTTQGDPGTNEVQRISASPTPISGTFTLTFSGQTTSALNFNATAAEIDTALEALSNIGTGDVTCTGGPITSAPVVVTFGGALASTNVAELTASSSLLGAAPTLSVATSTNGVASVNEQQQLYASGILTGGTYSLTYSGQTTASLSYLSTAAEVQAALIALSNIGDSDVVCTLGALPTDPIVVDFQGTLAGTNLSEMTVNNSITGGGWARGASSLTYTNVQAPSDRRVVSRQVLRNKFGNATVFYVDVDTTDLTSTTFTTVNTDEMLGAAVALQDANGFDLNVIRHGEPPNSKRAIASFLNRIFLAVNHVSTSGELAVTNASASIVGQDAFFRTVYDGRSVYPIAASNQQPYLIDSLNVGTQTLTATDTYDGSTANGIAYGLETAAPDDLTLYFSELDDAESWNVLNGLTLTRDEQDGELTGICPLVTSMLVLFENRSSKLTFRASPLLSSSPEFGGDGRVVPAAYRGCVNNRCCIKAGGLAYILDNKGIWTYDDSTVNDLSDPIAPMFHAGHQWSIYWAAKESFHAVFDSLNNTVKFFVVIGDGQLPKHAICYNVDRRRFWLESYPWPITSSVLGRMGNQPAVFYGSTGRRIFVATENLDGIDVNANANSTLRGTVTSARAFTLTDTTASFPTASLVNAPIVMVSGTSAGQQNIIVSATSTKLTFLKPWVIAPRAGDVYQIGGIPFAWRSQMMRLTQAGSEQLRGVQVSFTPNTRPTTVVARLYPDYDSDAKEFAADYNSDGVSTTNGSDQIVLNFSQSYGFVEIASDGFFAGRGTHTRQTTVDLVGVTNGEQIQINQIDVLGVES